MSGTVTINGRSVEILPDMTMAGLLGSLGYDIRRIAVEIDGEICPRSELPATAPVDGNKIEVVSFVGGG